MVRRRRTDAGKKTAVCAGVADLSMDPDLAIRSLERAGRMSGARTGERRSTDVRLSRGADCVPGGWESG